MAKLLFVTAEGIGNVIQTLPTLRTLKKVLGHQIDTWWAFGNYPIPHIAPYSDKWFSGGEISNINPAEYVGKVSTYWTRNHMNAGPISEIPLLAMSDSVRPDRSEVDTYMDIARKLGAKEEDLLWYGKCNYTSLTDEYDLVIHDGYKKRGKVSDSWKLKSYPYYCKVVELLSDLKICSVGSWQEFIAGTIDRTGLNLLSTGGVMHNSGLFLGNDSGLYHYANGLGVKNIVIFTYTSTMKNYDKRFHEYSRILQNDRLDCLSCQNTKRFKTCKTRECREIDPEIVANAVREELDGHSVQ